MSANTTNSSKRKMDCAWVAREEIIEAYLGGRLTEEERDAFEEHYFECARCFDDLRSLQAIGGELQRAGAEFEAQRRHPFLRWGPAAGLAAAAVLAVAVLWMRPNLPSSSPGATKTPPSSEAQSPEKPRPQKPPPRAASEPSVEQLARIEPPRYEPQRLRDVPDEATKRFERGMEQYRKADYAGAVDGLRAAADLDPDGVHILFFLGVSHLMLGQDDAAIERLRATIARGDSAYLEEAHWYLAKTFLRRKDFGAAESQLKTVIQLRGPKRGEARRLLTDVERFKGRS